MKISLPPIMEYLNFIKGRYLLILPKLELISIIISAVLLAGIFYILLRFKYAVNWTDFWEDVLRGGISRFSQKRVARGWRRILKLLRSHSAADWRTALIEADDILGEVLKLADYQGVNLDEQLKQISRDQLSAIEELRKIHHLVKRLKQDPEHLLDKITADEFVYIYGKTFRELRLL